MFIVGTNHLRSSQFQGRISKLQPNLRSISEQVVHLFERALLRLRLRGPEVERVGEVADDEKDVEAPSDVLHGDRGDLSDHGVEGEGDHHADGDTLGTSAGIKLVCTLARLAKEGGGTRRARNIRFQLEQSLR